MVCMGSALGACHGSLRSEPWRKPFRGRTVSLHVPHGP
jgi:hypothetical protein